MVKKYSLVTKKKLNNIGDPIIANRDGRKRKQNIDEARGRVRPKYYDEEGNLTLDKPLNSVDAFNYFNDTEEFLLHILLETMKVIYYICM